MRKTRLIQYGSTRVTKLILYGSICVSLVLTALLFVYDTIVIHDWRLRSFVGVAVVLYLLATWLVARKKHLRIVSWMLIILYSAVAFSTLLFWGINAAAGIFATSFVIILSGALLGSRAILPVSIVIAVQLFIIQVIHSNNIITPDISALTAHSSYFDIISYIMILGVFSLITWISDNQIEKTLERAKAAEATVRAQKDTLTHELEQESVRLREIQLKEIRQLYQFATLGQSTAATLHELSNHLSILNMDIDDLKQQHRNSKAIANAEDGIEQINLMVRQTRRKLDSYDNVKTFTARVIIRQAIKDLSEKYKSKAIVVRFTTNNLPSTQVSGDPLALSQIVTILVNNAIDACLELPGGKVSIELNANKTSLFISVIDNGIGISKSQKAKLFTPTLSTKPSGMGVGLYIAKHLAESQFKGSIHLESHSKLSTGGAHFVVTLPLAKVSIGKT